MEARLDMRVASRTNPISSYVTWYDFRRELGKKLGYMPLNWQWLNVKPKSPLPWDDSHMHAALSALARLEKQKAPQKRTENEQPSNGKK